MYMCVHVFLLFGHCFGISKNSTIPAGIGNISDMGLAFLLSHSSYISGTYVSFWLLLVLHKQPVSANSPQRQPMAYWLSFPHRKQWLHHCSPFARNFEHLGEYGLTSCLPCLLPPVHLFPLPSLDWEDVPDLALTSVLSASTAALSSWKSDLVPSVDLGSVVIII